MISKCSENWHSDKQRTKCENAPSGFSYPVEDVIPVVEAKGKTYRNKHCALCNGVENYTAWYFEVFTYIIPPDKFDLDSKLKFIVDNGGTIMYLEPKRGQPWRTCFGRNFIDKCNLTNHTSYKACVEGPVEVVYNSLVDLFFKNSACASCNGFHDINSYDFRARCPYETLTEGFSIVFDLKNASIISTITSYCPRGTVYDTTLKFCREGGYFISPSSKLTDEFLILLWFKQSRRRTVINLKLENDLKSTLTTQFWLRGYQISKMAFHHQDNRNDLFVATFRLTLTPFQSLIMANQQNSNFNVTHEDTAFLKLLNFTRNFTLFWKENSFSVVKVTSKLLSCYGEKKLQSDEYQIGEGNGSLIVNKTGKEFSLKDYIMVRDEDENITLCRKLVLPDCREGAYMPSSPDEYFIFPNLTVYHNATESVFNFGEYLISENKWTSNISNTTRNSTFPSNSTISFCSSFDTMYIPNTTSYALQILTSVGFSMSIISLLLLLITHGLFQELRTVSGMNLMNLNLSMLLSHLVWLIGTNHFRGTTACKVFAMLEHYLFQVSFLAMSVISHHSYYVFLQPSIGRVANIYCRRFIKYSVYVWLTPAIFVAICVTLDRTGAFLVDYGTNCWLGTVSAKLYLFLLPLAILLLYNIFIFIRTAVSLSRHDKDRQALQRKEGKQNLLICTKLATLVSFPWLFVFIGLLFPDVEVFDYLFVIFVCLQGLYIGIVFLFNKKTLKLYKDRWNVIGSRRNTSYTSAPSFEMPTK